MKGIINKINIFKNVGMNYLNYKLGKPQPFFCLYVSTLKCNLRCKHCFVESPHQYDKNKKEYWDNLGNDLTTEQAKYAIDQLYKIGISVLHITGGEPLLRKDLEQIAIHAKMKGMYVSMDTNGTLMTTDRAKSLGCFERIGISLDGIGEIHDLIRGEHTFEKATNAINLLKQYTSSIIGVVFTINKMNYQNIDQLFEFAREHCDFITFLPIDNIQELSLNEENAKEVGKKILKLKTDNYSFIENPVEYIELLPSFLQGKTAIECNVECHPCALYYVLGPSGDLSGCSSLHSYVGNVLKDDIKDMHKLGISKINDIRSKCGGCSITCAIQNSMLFNQSIYRAIIIASYKFR